MRFVFRYLLAAEVVSNFGAMLSRVAIPWLAALSLDVTPFQMGFLVVSDVVAGAAGSLLLGALVDRLDKRAVMIASDVGRAFAIALLALLAARGRLTFGVLVAAAAASGIMTVMFELARSAWIAQLVPAAELPDRNAQMSMGTSLSETVAFALGGWLYQALGVVLALAVDAVSYLVSALLVRKVPSAPSAQAASARADALRAMVGDVGAGLRAIASTPILRLLATVEALVALAMGISGASYMIFVARDLGFDTGSLGMIFATGGIGSLAGAWLAPRLGKRWGWSGAMVAGLVLLAFGAFCVPLAMGATVVGAVLLIAHQVVGDGGYTVYDVHDRSLRQIAAAPELLARVDAGIRTLGQLARLAGAVGGGYLATELGTRTGLTLAAAIFAAAAIIACAQAYLRSISSRT